MQEQEFLDDGFIPKIHLGEEFFPFLRSIDQDFDLQIELGKTLPLTVRLGGLGMELFWDSEDPSAYVAFTPADIQTTYRVTQEDFNNERRQDKIETLKKKFNAEVWARGNLLILTVKFRPLKSKSGSYNHYLAEEFTDEEIEALRCEVQFPNGLSFTCAGRIITSRDNRRGFLKFTKWYPSDFGPLASDSPLRDVGHPIIFSPLSKPGIVRQSKFRFYSNY